MAAGSGDLALPGQAARRPSVAAGLPDQAVEGGGADHVSVVDAALDDPGDWLLTQRARLEEDAVAQVAVPRGAPDGHRARHPPLDYGEARPSRPRPAIEGQRVRDADHSGDQRWPDGFPTNQ